MNPIFDFGRISKMWHKSAKVHVIPSLFGAPSYFELKRAMQKLVALSFLLLLMPNCRKCNFSLHQSDLCQRAKKYELP